MGFLKHLPLLLASACAVDMGGVSWAGEAAQPRLIVAGGFHPRFFRIGEDELATLVEPEEVMDEEPEVLRLTEEELEELMGEEESERLRELAAQGSRPFPRPLWHRLGKRGAGSVASEAVERKLQQGLSDYDLGFWRRFSKRGGGEGGDEWEEREPAVPDFFNAALWQRFAKRGRGEVERIFLRPYGPSAHALRGWRRWRKPKRSAEGKAGKAKPRPMTPGLFALRLFPHKLWKRAPAAVTNARYPPRWRQRALTTIG